MDRSKLISLVTTRAAAGIAVVAVIAGAGGAVALTSSPAGSHQHPTVLTVGNSTSSETPEATDTPEATEAPDTSDSGTNSDTHGDLVTAAVSSCKASASAAHTHGIGDCVSDVASSNGQKHRHTETTTETGSHTGG